ncbi:MAG: zf-HC2 domain-containing protein [Woeseiaceae bacterium]|nr:zf-HC2 domain-containing protein [Woeseiaceae bacterium]
MNPERHVGELLSGYIDGELTSQDRQRVDVHCDACEQCRNQLAELRTLREQIGNARLSELGEDTWRENMNDFAVKSSRRIGWVLAVGGVLVLGGIAVFDFVTDPTVETRMKLLIGAVYGGLALLLVSVLRQRLIERRTDKYKDVEI